MDSVLPTFSSDCKDVVRFDRADVSHALILAILDGVSP